MPSFFRAAGFFAYRSILIRLPLLVALLGISAGCGGDVGNGPQTMHESLVELQEKAKQMESGGGSPNASPPAELTDEKADPGAAGIYQVKFETSAGDFVIEVYRDWAPTGAERFHRLVKAGFYDDCRFFRVLPDFMVQFGINGNPATQKEWERNIPDDLLGESNRKGYVTFATAGTDTRTTQVFINYKDNTFLDAQGFTPFGKVIEGMSVVEGIFSEYGETPDQGQIQAQGNEYLNKEFPKLDYIRRASLIEEPAK